MFSFLAYELAVYILLVDVEPIHIHMHTLLFELLY